MNKKCRGYACIISVFKVDGHEARLGTEKDCDNLTKLFRQLNFAVKAYNDGDGLYAEVSSLISSIVLLRSMFLANVNSLSRSLYVVALVVSPSVVCNVRAPYSGD